MHLYFIRAGGFVDDDFDRTCIVKIGLAKDPKKRLRQLQTGNPQRLTLMHWEEVPEKQARAIERAFHAAFAPWRLHGEWFAPCGAIEWILLDLTHGDTWEDALRTFARGRAA